MIKDLRYSLRMLAKTPGFTIAAVLTLALGVGANTATFSLFNSLFLRQPQADRPDRLVRMYGTASEGSRFDVLSYPNYLDLRDRTETLEGLAASQLFGIGRLDPLTFSAVTVLLAAVGQLACYLPARRAARVDPAIALRYE